MTERLRRVLRFALARPALVFLAALGGVIVTGATVADRQPEPAWIGPVILSCLATAYLSVVQSLRVLWRQSRPRCLALAAVIFVIGILVYKETGTVGDVGLAWSPLALAVLLDLALRWVRAWRGPLWLDRPAHEAADDAAAEPSSPASRPDFWKRHRGGCLGALALALAFLAVFVWQLTLPARHAQTLRSHLRPGMTVAQVVDAAQAPFIGSLSVPAEINTREPLFRVIANGDRRSFQLREGPMKALTRAELEAALSQQATALAAHEELWLWFTFRSTLLPLKVSVRVIFGEGARLKGIRPNSVWD